MRRAKGRDIVIGAAPPPKRGQVIDIMEALKRSMERVPAKKKPAAAAVTKEEKEGFLIYHPPHGVQLLVALTRRRTVQK
jgi:hypothetical protein